MRPLEISSLKKLRNSDKMAVMLNFKGFTNVALTHEEMVDRDFQIEAAIRIAKVSWDFSRSHSRLSLISDSFPDDPWTVHSDFPAWGSISGPETCFAIELIPEHSSPLEQKIALLEIFEVNARNSVMHRGAELTWPVLFDWKFKRQIFATLKSPGIVWYPEEHRFNEGLTLSEYPSPSEDRPEQGPGANSIALKCQQNLQDDGTYLDPVSYDELNADTPILITDNGYCFNASTLKTWFARRGRAINPMTNEKTSVARITNCKMPTDCAVPQKFNELTKKLRDAPVRS